MQKENNDLKYPVIFQYAMASGEGVMMRKILN